MAPCERPSLWLGSVILESGRLQLRALASVGKKQLNLGRLFKIPYCKAHLYWQGVRILKRETKSTYNTALLFCLFVFVFVFVYGIISGQKQLEHFNVILQGRICFTEENFNEFQHSTQYSIVTVFN